MKHQQYREWALEGALLPPDQKDELKQHLQSCPECRQWHQALTQVDALFTGATRVQAPAGFADRFQAKLAAVKAGRQRRQAWLVLAASLGGSLALVGMMTYVTLANMPRIIGQLLKGFLNFSSQLAVAGDVIRGFMAVLPTPAADLLGLSLLVALIGSALVLFASLGGLWAAAVFRFAYPTNRTGGSK
jgi:anti-sigma factor RsiW